MVKIVDLWARENAMLQKMIPKTIAVRTYLITTALITLVMADVGYLYANETERTIILDHQRQMTTIAANLSREVYARELQGDFARAHLSGDEAALRALRETLQPVVSEMARQHPGFNLGVSMYDRRVAFHPFRPDSWEVPVPPSVLDVYNTTAMTVIQAAPSSLLGQTTMTVIHPVQWRPDGRPRLDERRRFGSR